MQLSKAGEREAISNKIRVLKNEGDRQDVAVAKSLSMARAGRLTRGGDYLRVSKRGGGSR